MRERVRGTMREAAKRRTPGQATLAVLGALLAALVVAVGLCEWLGWPFLRGPIERALESRVQRDVQIGADFRASLLGGLKLQADSFSIGPPEEHPAGAPERFVDATDIELVFPYRTLFAAVRGSGEPLEVTSLRVAQLDAHLWRGEEGPGNWQFGPEAAEADEQGQAIVIPRFERLVVREGRLRITDAPAKLRLTASVRTNEGSAASEAGGDDAGLRISADGSWQGRPLRARIASSGLLPLAESTPQSDPLPVSLVVKSADTSFEFDGQAADVLHLHSLDGRFAVSGPTLAAAGEIIGVTLPNTPPFQIGGRVRKDDVVWSADVGSFATGKSRLAGEFRYDPRPETALLSGTLRGDRLSLADLAPTVGAAPDKRSGARDAVKGGQETARKAQASKRQAAKRDTAARQGAESLLPSREFDIPSLHAMNASVAVDLKRLDLSTGALQSIAPLKAQLELKNGLLALREIDARTGGGRLRGEISLDSRRQPPLWAAGLAWSGVDLAKWIRVRNEADESGSGEYLTGFLSGRAELRGSGRSTAAILGSLDGTISTWIRDGSISHLVVEATGLDIAQGVGLLVVGDDALPLNCAVLQLQAKDGELHTEVGILDTPDSTVFVSGSVSLDDEKLGLLLAAKPKDFSPLTVRAPVHIEGTFVDPKVRPDAKSIGLKLAAAAALAAITPLAALIPLMDPADPAVRRCSDVLGEVRKPDGGKPAPKPRQGKAPQDQAAGR